MTQEAEIAQLKKQLSELVERFSEVVEQLSTAEARESQLLAQVSAMQAENQALQEQVAVAHKRIEELEKQKTPPPAFFVLATRRCPLLAAWEAAVRASSAVENWHSVVVSVLGGTSQPVERDGGAVGRLAQSLHCRAGLASRAKSAYAQWHDPSQPRLAGSLGLSTSRAGLFARVLD